MYVEFIQTVRVLCVVVFLNVAVFDKTLQTCATEALMIRLPHHAAFILSTVSD